MKRLELTKTDLALLVLFTMGFSLLLTGALLKSLWAVAGVIGLITAWFLCIDNIIANHKMPFFKLIIFGGIVLFMPLFFAVYLSA